MKIRKWHLFKHLENCLLREWQNFNGTLCFNFVIHIHHLPSQFYQGLLVPLSGFLCSFHLRDAYDDIHLRFMNKLDLLIFSSLLSNSPSMDRCYAAMTNLTFLVLLHPRENRCRHIDKDSVYLVYPEMRDQSSYWKVHALYFFR